MNPADIRQAIVDAWRRIAPEADAAAIDGDANVREELDIDSMDFLRFVLALHDRLGVDVPEADYTRLSTMNGAVSYLAARLDHTGASR
jgi:acyl carrier protein